MSSDNKKDLTRIEDLGEFLHELNSDEDFSENEVLPEIPADDFPSSFESSEPESNEGNASFEPSPFEGTFESTFEDNISLSGEDPFTSNESFEVSTFSDETPFGKEPLNSTAEDQDSEKIEDEKPSWDLSVIEEAKEELPEAGPLPELESSPTESYRPPETFEDLKQFSESSSFTGMATEGNPSFSVLVKNVRYLEDVNDIVSLLKEFDLLADSEEQTKNRLLRGNLLVPRISEYAAIFLGHKLRRFDVDIQIGPSDEIHPPRHQETPEIGIVSKHSLYQNTHHSFHFDDPKLELSQIIVAATPGLEGHQVIRYLGVASEHKMLESSVVEDENSSDIPAHYQELAQKLKAHALKQHANAVIGLNYQLTPLPSEYGSSGHKYRLSCTGNLVWVNKL